MWTPNLYRLNTAISIEKRVETIISGKSKISYAPAFNPNELCQWENRGGTELEADNSIIVVDTATVTMWYRPDITAMDRIILDGKTYEIMNVENVKSLNMWLILKVKRATVG
jgi:SPP1 family predicted phage head-tail adaptor